MKQAIRYSEAFKMQVVREIESQEISGSQMQKKYGIGGSDTVAKWVRKYGNGLLGKVIRVETPNEINELKRLKERVKRLEALLADTNLELALERQYTRMACARAGIEDIVEFKKKADGKPPTGP
jgi:transposase